jgi:hypothetical protein
MTTAEWISVALGVMGMGGGVVSTIIVALLAYVVRVRDQEVAHLRAEVAKQCDEQTKHERDANLRREGLLGQLTDLSIKVAHIEGLTELPEQIRDLSLAVSRVEARMAALETAVRPGAYSSGRSQQLPAATSSDPPAQKRTY